MNWHRRIVRRASGSLHLACVIFLVSGCEQRPPAMYELPIDYRGWVQVRFERQGYPPLPTENGADVFRIPTSGVLSTSSSAKSGWGKSEYYYASATKRHQLPALSKGDESLIWGGVYTGGSPDSEERNSVRFFVGTRVEYERAMHSLVPPNHSPLARPTLK